MKGYQLECILKWQLLEMKGEEKLEDLEKNHDLSVFHHRLEYYLELILKGVKFKKTDLIRLKCSFKECNGIWTSEERYSPESSSAKEKKTCDSFFKNADIVVAHLITGG